MIVSAEVKAEMVRRTAVDIHFEEIQRTRSMLQETQAPQIFRILRWNYLAKAGKWSQLQSSIETDFNQAIDERLAAKGVRGFEVLPRRNGGDLLVMQRIIYNPLQVTNIVRPSYTPLRHNIRREDAIVAAMDTRGNLRLYHEDVVRDRRGVVSSAVSDMTLLPSAAWAGDEGSIRVAQGIAELYRRHPATK